MKMMSRLTREGTAKHVSRDQIIGRERGQGNIHFPCSAHHEQDWQLYPAVDPYPCYVCVAIRFILDVRVVDAPAGVPQEEGHTGFLHLPSAVLALIFLAKRIQPQLVGPFLISFFFLYFCEEKSQFV